MDKKDLWKRLPTVLLTLALLLPLAACGPSWEATLSAPDGSVFIVDSEVLQSQSDFAEEVDHARAVPLERVLVAAGHSAVKRVEAVDVEGTRREYDWGAVADEAWWLSNGQLLIGGEQFQPSRLEIEPPALLARAMVRITDLAPTAAAALGIPAPDRATGRASDVPSASHVVLILLDGFGYFRHQEVVGEGLIPNIGALGEPQVGLTTYPPVTNVSMASLLTGAPPAIHGVDRRGIRKTQLETLFDTAAECGLSVVAVEGDSLAFSLRNAQMKLSGDLDANGSTNDNVLSNALAVLRTGTPDMFFVHFHGIDDAGHTYGPGSLEERAQIAEVDAAVGQIMELVSPDTLVIIFADHGMHSVAEEGRLGNHGQLIERDMFVPVFMVSK